VPFDFPKEKRSGHFGFYSAIKQRGIAKAQERDAKSCLLAGTQERRNTLWSPPLEGRKKEKGIYCPANWRIHAKNDRFWGLT